MARICLAGSSLSIDAVSTLVPRDDGPEQSLGRSKMVQSREAERGGFASLKHRSSAFTAVGVVLLVLFAAGAPIAAASVWTFEFIPKPSDAEDVYLNHVSCTSRTNCMAVGSYSTKSGDYPCPRESCLPLVEQWNGIRWSIQPSPRLPARRGGYESGLNAVSCTRATACTAVGFYSASRTDYYHALIERWNGRAWSIQSTNTIGELTAVSCPSTRSCAAVATGYTKTPTGYGMALQWNGRTWLPHRVGGDPDFGNGSPGGLGGGDVDLYGVSCSSASVVLV